MGLMMEMVQEQFGSKEIKMSELKKGDAVIINDSTLLMKWDAPLNANKGTVISTNGVDVVVKLPVGVKTYPRNKVFKKDD